MAPTSPPLLKTKLYIPQAREDWVARPRLIHKLEASRRRPGQMTLVVAPAGFGKTTLLAAWHAAHPSTPLAWVSLDDDDNDPFRFWSYVAAALESLAPLVPAGALTSLPVEQLPEETTLTHLVNEVAAISEPLVLVLDDLHTITNPEIHTWLGFVIDHLPPTLHLVINSRAMPPIPLARLRAQGRLTEIVADDLRFDEAETAAFLRTLVGMGLAPEQIALLASRTEGWVAGLQLAGLSLRTTDDVADAIAHFSGRSPHVVDYFAEEVIGHQPQQVRDFLLETAFLDQLNASLCNAITGRDDSGEILTYLEQHNLFLAPQDDQRAWFAYHRLFAEHLRARQKELYGTQGIAARHQRASDWCLAHDMPERAITHALLAENYEKALQLLDAHAFSLLSQGQATTVERWLQRFPADLQARQPVFSLLAAWTALSATRFDEAEPAIARLEQHLEAGWLSDAPVSRRDIEGQVMAIRATVAMNADDTDRARPLMREALDSLHPANAAIRSVVALDLADAALVTDDIPEALRLYRSALETAQPSGNLMISINAMSKLARLQMLQGNLHAAAESYQTSLQTLKSQGWDELPVAGMLAVGMTWLLYEWNALDRARVYGEHALRLLEQWGHRYHITEALIVLAKIAQAQGRRDEAETYLDRATTHARRHNLRATEHWVWETSARFALADGDQAAARQRYRQAAAQFSQTEFRGSLRSLRVARPLILEQRYGEADALLAEWASHTTSRGLVAQRIEVGVLQALSAWAQGKRDTAMQALGIALRLAESGDFVRTFVDEGPPMAAVLQLAIERGMTPDYATRLLGAFSQRAPVLPDPLSSREEEVLRLIAAQLSNQEIAETLFVSINTVKTHIRRLYNKLGASSRLEAVIRAQELGLL